MSRLLPYARVYAKDNTEFTQIIKFRYLLCLDLRVADK